MRLASPFYAARGHLRNTNSYRETSRRPYFLFFTDIEWNIGHVPAMAEAFLKWGGLKPMTRFSSSATKDGSGEARNCKKGGGQNFYIFSSVFFSAELI